MNSLEITKNKVNFHDLKKRKIFLKTDETNLDYTEIIVKAAKFGKDCCLKVEAQGNYKNIKGVAREFTVKLKHGKNLIGKDKESGLNEYFDINEKELTHYYKKRAGRVDYNNPIINKDNYSWISLTDNKNMLIFPYNVGLKISEDGKLIWWLWEVKQKQGWDLLIEKDYWNKGNYNIYPKGFQQSKSTRSSDSDSEDPEIVLTQGEKLLIDGKRGQSREEVFLQEKNSELVLFIGAHYSNPSNIYNEYRLQPIDEDRFCVDIDESSLQLLTDYANEIDFERNRIETETNEKDKKPNLRIIIKLIKLVKEIDSIKGMKVTKDWSESGKLPIRELKIVSNRLKEKDKH